MQHLDEQSYLALQRLEPAAVAHFREHLKTPCEQCEAFLAREASSDLLDGAADEVLGARAELDAPLGEVGWARLKRKMAPAPASRRWAVGGGIAALAAAVLLVISVPRSHG